MDQALGVLLLAAYIVGVVGLAAGITWAIVRIFPTERNGNKSRNGDKPPSTSDAGTGGRLFRKAKRGAT